MRLTDARLLLVASRSLRLRVRLSVRVCVGLSRQAMPPCMTTFALRPNYFFLNDADSVRK